MLRLLCFGWLAACAPDPNTALPPAGSVCDALAAGELAADVAVDGPQIDATPTARGEDWSAAGWWGDVPCGELFAGVVVDWAPLESGGEWRLLAGARHAGRGRAEGLRFPALAMWSDGESCGCDVAESGVVEALLSREPGNGAAVLVGLESTADRQHHLDPGAGFSVPYRVQAIPTEAP